MTQAVIRGTYADFKLVKTRNVVQMIVEVPVEEAERVTATFGIPHPQEEKWVAVALLDTRKVENNTRANKAIQQAGILCKEISFGEFLKHKVPEVNPKDQNSIANGIRTLAGVKSRSDFKNNETALKIWERLYDEYRASAQ
tara:strand:+ start:350 stop:772 length:423 start_codon:yes stop_codon:yes gene_type:complete